MNTTAKSLRREATDFAESTVRSAISSVVDAIEREVAWKRAHPHRIALFHERMVGLLATAPGRVPFRRARIRTHQYLERRWAARAWALDRDLAETCRLCVD